MPSREGGHVGAPREFDENAVVAAASLVKLSQLAAHAARQDAHRRVFARVKSGPALEYFGADDILLNLLRVAGDGCLDRKA
jgi:hypothetical protein